MTAVAVDGATRTETPLLGAGVRRSRHAARRTRLGRIRLGRGRVRLVAGLLALAAVTGVLAGALCWRATGGMWFVVKTPSMGQAAPVGTLLLTRPTTVAETHVGDVITFHSPGGQTYSHRVVAKTARGLRTRGDINAVADPWTITDRDLVGRVAARWWAVGWALRALPLMLLGLAIAWTLAAFVAPRRRSAVRQLGTTVSVTATTWWLHPWVGLEKLGITSLAGAAAHQTGSTAVAMRVVSTGILPVSVRDAGGGPTSVVQSGQAADVAIRHQNRAGAYNLDAGLHLTFWWWVAVVLACLAPLAFSLLTAPRPVEPAPDDDTDAEAAA